MASIVREWDMDSLPVSMIRVSLLLHTLETTEGQRQSAPQGHQSCLSADMIRVSLLLQGLRDALAIAILLSSLEHRRTTTKRASGPPKLQLDNFRARGYQLLRYTAQRHH